MKLARSRLPVARERTGGDSLLASPVHLGGRSAVQLPYNLISYFPNSAKSRGVRCLSGPAAMLKISGSSDCPELVQHLPVETWAKAGASTASPSPLFPKVNDNRTHSQPPVQRLASVNMEESVSEVCKTKSCSVSASDIQKARDIHQRHVVRMMVSPGDSKGTMYRIEAAFGLSYHCQVNLRHQNRASGEFIARLNAVWLAVLEQSVRRDVAELLEKQAKAEEAA